MANNEQVTMSARLCNIVIYSNSDNQYFADSALTENIGDKIPLFGEMVIVLNEKDNIVKAKIGDGVRSVAELDYAFANCVIEITENGYELPGVFTVEMPKVGTDWEFKFADGANLTNINSIEAGSFEVQLATIASELRVPGSMIAKDVRIDGNLTAELGSSKYMPIYKIIPETATIEQELINLPEGQMLLVYEVEVEA